MTLSEGWCKKYPPTRTLKSKDLNLSLRKMALEALLTLHSPTPITQGNIKTSKDIVILCRRWPFLVWLVASRPYELRFVQG